MVSGSRGQRTADTNSENTLSTIIEIVVSINTSVFQYTVADLLDRAAVVEFRDCICVLMDEVKVRKNQGILFLGICGNPVHA